MWTSFRLVTQAEGNGRPLMWPDEPAVQAAFGVALEFFSDQYSHCRVPTTTGRARPELRNGPHRFEICAAD